MAKYQINVAAEKCAGCLRCQLACSDAYTKSFNLSASRIKVVMSGVDCAVHFAEDCVQCGKCADQCFFGALSKTRKHEEDQ